ncbi:heterokaryon incompatibility protein-domain-containing protein, partial [Dactylonectria estremocensis]
RLLPYSTGSEECFALAKGWRDRCVAQSKAGQHGNQPFWPSRIIDVGPCDGSMEPRLKIHSQEETDDSMEWVTLSHCWGGESPLRTTTDTIEQRLRGIPMDTLPRTFADAVIITRNLGYQYLWIDSLCIIQDSIADWEAESSRMGAIYMNCAMNIAAAQASNCYDGIFTDRWVEFEAIKLPLKSKGLEIDDWFYVTQPNYQLDHDCIVGYHSKLGRRGWALQELVLSPRTLHYTRDRIYWECEHCIKESGSIMPLYSRENPLLRQVTATQFVSHKLALPPYLMQRQPLKGPLQIKSLTPTERDECHTSWLRLVQNFSCRSLSIESDVLPALAGIAAVFQARLQEPYYAGIFGGNMISSLLWRRIPPSLLRDNDIWLTEHGQSMERRQGVEIPSWSWASISGPIQSETFVDAWFSRPWNLIGSMTATIVSCETYLPSGLTASSHHTIGIKGGLLSIQGCVSQAGSLSDASYGAILLAGGRDAECREDDYDGNTLRKWMTELKKACLTNTHPWLPWTHYKEEVGTRDKIGWRRCTSSFDETPAATGRFCVLHLGSWSSQGDIDTVNSEEGVRFFDSKLCGLVLEEVDQERLVYRRVGMTRVDLRIVDPTHRQFPENEESFLEEWDRKTISIV